jgi:hypothetical protein
MSAAEIALMVVELHTPTPPDTEGAAALKPLGAAGRGEVAPDRLETEVNGEIA